MGTTTKEIAYCRQRAAIEDDQAQRATKAEVIMIHRALADAYLDRIGRLERAAGRIELRAVIIGV